MESHEDDLAQGQPVSADQKTRAHQDAPRIDEMPPTQSPQQSGKSTLLHWGLLIGGIAVIGLIAWMLE